MIFLDPTKHKTPLSQYDYPTVTVDGWPEPHLIARPNDAIGQAIIEFAKKYSADPDFPASPWDDRTGRINLVPPDQPRPEKDAMPRYRLTEDAFLGASLYSKGQEVNFPGWPARPFTLEAMNMSAELVLSYQSRFGPGRTLPGQPHVAGVLHLPNVALLSGSPQPFSHRGSFGGPSLVA